MAWRIENASADEADIFIYDIIGDPWTGTTAADFVKDLHALGEIARLNLHVNSPGGYVNAGLAIYNALLQHPAQVTAFIESEASSAASFVVMAADKVVIARTAKMFVHDAQGIGIGNARDMASLAAMLDEESENIASIYAEKTGKPASEWRDAMQANDGIGSTYRGQAAVDVGLADEVGAGPSKTTRNEAPRALDVRPGFAPVAATTAAESTITLPDDFGASWREAAAYPKPKPSLEALLTKQAATAPLKGS